MSDEKVTYAFGAVPPSEAQERLVKVAREAVEMTESGRIKSILVIMVDQGGDAIMNFSCPSWLEILGAIERTKHRIQLDIDEMYRDVSESEGA